MNYGMTEQGFNIKRLADIKREIQERVRAIYGNKINLRDSSQLGQLVGIFSERESLLWELLEAIYNSQFPMTAQGLNLDNVLTITGLVRLPALRSTSMVNLFGVAGTIVPAGTIFSVDGNETAKFRTTDAATLVSGQDEVQKIEFDDDPDAGYFRLSYRGEITAQIDWNAGALAVQTALDGLNKIRDVSVSGNFASGFTVTFQGVDGKINQPLLLVDENTLTKTAIEVPITVTEITPGIAQALVAVESIEYGPIVAEAYSLTVIDNPVTGLDAVLNTEDATPGRNVETDNEAKIRRVNSLQIVGAGTVPSIRAKLLTVQDVEEAIVFENTTLVTDINGIPAKAFRCYVLGGDDTEIAEAIFSVKPAGIQTDGTESVVITDSQGVSQTINFSRPDTVPIYANFELTVDGNFPVNGLAEVRALVAEYINNLKIGEDVIVYPKLMAELNKIPGIIDVDLGIDTTASPTLGADDNIDIALNEIARIVDAENDIAVALA